VTKSYKIRPLGGHRHIYDNNIETCLKLQPDLGFWIRFVWLKIRLAVQNRDPINEPFG